MCAIWHIIGDLYAACHKRTMGAHPLRKGRGGKDNFVIALLKSLTQHHIMTRSQPEWKSSSQRAKSMRKRNLIAYHASECNLFYDLECSCGTSHQASDHRTHILDEKPHSILASSLLPING